MGIISDVRITPMIECGMAVIGAAVIAPVFIWCQIASRKQICEINVRLAQMQRELDILQVQASRRTIMAFKANSKVEAPRIEFCDSDPTTSTAATPCG
jgi:hypothetical protein